ncbi:Type II/IV secretion system protein TadC, associated with Flp pilus assembly [Vibrio harveyi]|uniref:type II secretion system F family protein n=1 Tax=Vibrio harveyi TaxID=669 RepID=UPI000841E503|nr:type II secretion system F family protein [Vibrio harveyi]MCG9236855.1 type II secretion system F family protein [Vibrio harveyi]ODM59194.1 biotin synthase [Vibrio harveyi]CAH1222525.1 Type II/IV secretion system protein TadC, associated with Flp pilus assembly [Vibrio harveyi]CAH1553153.1 Type II/IV secretion system protein TadC, associated with Flp pilus assembly [Vibrio harveyi]CAH1570165.1 Type II/IV secretion system protein TadC, associated with Flp pilus assembly [Vibrio harveyi]
MMLLIALVVLFISLLFLIFDSLRTEQRRKKVALYIGGDAVRAPSRVNRFFVRFGKEHRHELEQKLIEAGYYNTEWAKFYFPAKLAVLVVVTGLVLLSDMTANNQLIIIIFTLIGVIVVPDTLLQMRRKMLISKTSSQLPYLLDMMSVCVQTGMTIEAALVYLGKELAEFDSDLCYQIKRTSDSAKIHGLEKALNDLSDRIPTPPIRSFVLTIIQNLQYGTSVAQVLSDLAEDMRKVQILTVEEKVGKLSAKMSIPLILFIMFPIVILILAPGIMQMNININI